MTNIFLIPIAVFVVIFIIWLLYTKTKEVKYVFKDGYPSSAVYSKKDIKQMKAWVQAMKSGKYRQIFHNVHTSIGYSNLGILYEVVIPNRDKKLTYSKHLSSYQPAMPGWAHDIFHVMALRINIHESNLLNYHFTNLATVMEREILAELVRI